MRLLKILIKWLLGIILFVILIITVGVLIFWYGEKERENLLVKYEVPSEFLNDILIRKQGSLDSIMKYDETIVCALAAYSRVEDLPYLNAQQKTSLPKENLPSEDLTWYLLFFSNTSISRIYLIDQSKLEFSSKEDDPCIGREGQFSVLSIKNHNQQFENVLNISKGVR